MAENQARSNKNKPKTPKNATEQSSPPGQLETLVDEAIADMDDFEDDHSVWHPVISVNKTVGELNKPDHWPRDFVKHVKQRQGELLKEAKVQIQAMTANEQHFQSQFHDLTAFALAPTGPTNMPDRAHPLQIQTTHRGLSIQPLYAKTTTLVTESKALLAQYHHLTQKQSDTSSRLSSLANQLAKDKEQAHRQIANARRVVEADIDSLLLDKTCEVPGRKTITADDETGGRQVLQIGKQAQQSKAGAVVEGYEDRDVEMKTEEWGKVAHSVQKAVKKLVKAGATCGEE